LQLVGESVFTDGTVVLPVLDGETFHHTRFVVPRQINKAFYAAVFALDLKTFLEIAAYRDGEIQMAERATGKFDVDVPTISAKAFPQTRVHAHDLAAQKTRRV